MHLGTYGMNDLPQYSTKAASVLAPSIFYSKADVFNDKLLIPINLRSNLTLATFELVSSLSSLTANPTSILRAFSTIGRMNSKYGPNSCLN